MLPEIALVKMMWVLGQTEDYDVACKMLRENIKGGTELGKKAKEFIDKVIFI